MPSWKFDIENIPKSYYKEITFTRQGKERTRKVLVKVWMFVAFDGYIFRAAWIPEKNKWTFGDGTPLAYQLDPTYPEELGEPAERSVFEVIQESVKSGESSFQT